MVTAAEIAEVLAVTAGTAETKLLSALEQDAPIGILFFVIERFAINLFAHKQQAGVLPHWI